MKFTRKNLSKISTKFDQNWALAFPASQCPVVPKSIGNVFYRPVTRIKTHFTLQKVVPASHGHDYQKYGFCYQPQDLKAAENLNSLYSKNRSRFPRSHLLCRVSVLGTTLIGIERKQKSWFLFYVGSDSILSVGVEA